MDLCDYCSERKEGCVEVKVDDVDEDGIVFTETYVLCPECNPEMLTKRERRGDHDSG